MGLYLETPGLRRDKAQALLREMGGVQVTVPPRLDEVPGDSLLVCVVNNGNWDAALVVADDFDHRRTTLDRSGRPLTWLLLPRAAVVENLRRHHPTKNLALYGIGA